MSSSRKRKNMQDIESILAEDNTSQEANNEESSEDSDESIHSAEGNSSQEDHNSEQSSEDSEGYVQPYM